MIFSGAHLVNNTLDNIIAILDETKAPCLSSTMLHLDLGHTMSMTLLPVCFPDTFDNVSHRI